jgi:hypothetical protein
MSDDTGNADRVNGEHPQPASEPMGKTSADWYVEYTRRQFGAHERDGRWYLHTSEAALGDRPATPVRVDE